MVAELNDETFNTKISVNKPTIVFFYKKDCEHSNAFAPKVDKLEKEFPMIKFYKLDVDEFTELAKDNNASIVPCLTLFRIGREIGKIVGNEDYDLVKEKISTHFKDYIFSDEELATAGDKM